MHVVEVKKKTPSKYVKAKTKGKTISKESQNIKFN